MMHGQTKIKYVEYFTKWIWEIVQLVGFYFKNHVSLFLCESNVVYIFIPFVKALSF